MKKNSTVDSELLLHANNGLKNRLENFILIKNKNKEETVIKKIYQDRLDHELNIINSMNYSSYFLIVSDYIRWAKKMRYQ